MKGVKAVQKKKGEKKGDEKAIRKVDQPTLDFEMDTVNLLFSPHSQNFLSKNISSSGSRSEKVQIQL